MLPEQKGQPLIVDSLVITQRLVEILKDIREDPEGCFVLAVNLFNVLSDQHFQGMLDDDFFDLMSNYYRLLDELKKDCPKVKLV